MGHVYRTFAGDSCLHGVAGRIIVSRVVTELSVEGLEERIGGMVDRICAIWVFPHNEHGISELAIRNSSDDCGIVLWVGLEAHGIDFCVGLGARSG